MSYTSIEQSKKLLELGLSDETADMRYQEYDDHIDGTPKVGYKAGVTPDIPCWSLDALFKLLPKIINHQTLNMDTSAALWHLGYPTINVERGANLTDVVYNMIAWLLENNYALNQK